MSLQQIDSVRVHLDKIKTQFQAALPPHVTVERFLRIAVTSVQQNQMLLECSQQSLITALLKCAQDGLLPDGREAAITIYRSKAGPIAQYSPMVGGILKKIRNSGEVKSVHPEIVYSKDEFDFFINGDGPDLLHRPNLDSDRGEPKLVYVVANTKDGGRYVEVMSKKDVMAIRDNSPGKNNGPWSGPFELEMWKKSAIRRLSKRLPQSTDAEDLMSRDDEVLEVEGERIETPSFQAASITQTLAAADPAPAAAKTENPAAEKKPSIPFTKPAPQTTTVVSNGGVPGAVAAPGWLKPDKPHPRDVIAKMCRAAFQKLDLNPVTAGQYIKEKTDKDFKDLDENELHFFYFDIVVPDLMKKGIAP